MTDLTDKQREMIEDGGWLHSSLIIEIQGNDKEHVKASLDRLVEKLKSEKGIDVYTTDFDEIQELKEKWYSLHVELKLLAKDFGRLTHVALTYSPSAIEILAPEKELKIPIGDAQNTLIDIANVVTSLAHAVFVQGGQLRKIQQEQGKKDNTKT